MGSLIMLRCHLQMFCMFYSVYKSAIWKFYMFGLGWLLFSLSLFSSFVSRSSQQTLHFLVKSCTSDSSRNKPTVKLTSKMRTAVAFYGNFMQIKFFLILGGFFFLPSTYAHGSNILRTLQCCNGNKSRCVHQDQVFAGCF